MTTTITISTDTPQGTLTVSHAVQDDARAQAVFNLVADAIGATGTPRQRLTAVLVWIVAQLVRAAKRRKHEEKAQEAIAAEAEINLD